MKTDNTLAAKSGEAKETRAEKAIRLLTTTAGSPFNQKIDEFKTFYPAVVAAKRNGMKNKQVIKILAEGGLKLYPALFEKLIAAMKRDAVANNCPHCGQVVDGQIDETAVVHPSIDEGTRPVEGCELYEEAA